MSPCCVCSEQCLTALFIANDLLGLWSLEGARIICIATQMCCLCKSYFKKQKKHCKSQSNSQRKGSPLKRDYLGKAVEFWKAKSVSTGRGLARSCPNRASLCPVLLNVDGGVRMSNWVLLFTAFLLYIFISGPLSVSSLLASQKTKFWASEWVL